GEVHVLAINEDAEVVEYYRFPGQDFSTQNITLALGNSGSPPQFPSNATASLPQPSTSSSPDSPGHGRRTRARARRPAHRAHHPAVADHGPKGHRRTLLDRIPRSRNRRVSHRSTWQRHPPHRAR